MRARLLSFMCLMIAAGIAQADRNTRPERPRLGILDQQRFESFASAHGVPIARAITEAEKKYKNQDYAEALKSFKGIQGMEGAAAIKPWAVCMEGMCLANQEKFEEARSVIKKALDANPKGVDAALLDYAYGSTYKLAYEDDKAVAHFDLLLDNPDRRQETNYFDRALEWQTEQYRNRSTSNPKDEKLKERFYHLLDMWVKEHPDRLSDYHMLYKFFRNQNKWQDCLRVSLYRMPPPDAAVSVLNDQLLKAQESCNSAKLGAEAAARDAAPYIAEFKAGFARLKDTPLDTLRSLTFQLVQTLLLCGMPEDGDKAAADWMAAHPGDRTAVYMYIGYIHAAKAARPDAMDRIVADFLKQKPEDDVRREMLELYAETAIPLYKDRAPIEKLLKEHGAPPSTMATAYTGWKAAEAEEAWRQVLTDTNALGELRFKAMMVLGDASYAKGEIASATNLYQMGLDYTVVNRKFAGELERFRDRIAQEQIKDGLTTNAMDLFKQNIYSRNPEYWTRANLFHAKASMTSKDIRTLMGGEQSLRRILGQYTKGGPWYLDIKYSEEPAIRKMQNEAKDLCGKYELDLTKPPLDDKGWHDRLKARSKAAFDERLKTQ